MSRLNLLRYAEFMEGESPFPESGFVTRSIGLTIEGSCPGAQRGGICLVTSQDGSLSVEAEVVGFKSGSVLLMPLDDASGIAPGASIRLLKKHPTFKVGPQLIGRVIDARGKVLDDLPQPDIKEEFSIYSRPLNPMKRARISEPMDVGVQAINGLVSLGKGQRFSVLAGSGVGKSVLLGMMAKNTQADINVIAMVGERGREVREFVEEALGPEGMARSIVIIATSDQSPLIRMRAAFAATTIAEYFRSQKKDVLLMMDSVTRFAMAQREVGLAAGEPPTTKGYPPSVFTLLPKLFERVGNLTSGGSITGIYTVLIEQDDINDPIGDAVRSIVDGHLVLSRKLAARNHYPAIDVGVSSSRVMPQVTSKEHQEYAGRLRGILATYKEAEDLINIGAYVKGSNPKIDDAIKHIDKVNKYLCQIHTEAKSVEESVTNLKSIFVGS